MSKVSIGFAAGGANSEKRSGTGTGTGGGVQVTPVAFISISGEKVHIHSLEKSDPTLSKILAVAPDVLKKVSQFVYKKSKKDKESDKEKKKPDK